MNSRTLVSEDTRTGKEGRNGSTYLIPCIDSHDPLDVVIVMLGTNELKHTFNNSPQYIGELLDRLFVKTILNRKSQYKDTYPKVLIVSLPIINETTTYAAERYSGGTEKSKQLCKIYSQIAKENACYFVDASEIAVGIDGVHLSEDGQKKLAELLYNEITKNLTCA